MSNQKIKRNLEADKYSVTHFTIGIAIDKNVSELKSVSLHAIDRAITAERSLEIATKALEHISNAYERELLDYPNTLEECVNVADAALDQIGRVET